MRTATVPGEPLLRVKEFAGGRRRTGRKGRAGKSGGNSRFLAPWYFDAETRADILARMEAAGLSDIEGRQLFLTAAEYEIGALRMAREAAPPQEPDPTPSEPATGPVPADLLRAAEALAAQLAALEPVARDAITQSLAEADPLGRGYGPAFLEQLRWVLERMTRIEAGPAAAAPREVPADVRRLVAQLARIYGECLEVRLEAGDLPLFHEVLAIIARASGLGIPTDPQTIAGILAS